jgi:hypothetical protein
MCTCLATIPQTSDSTIISLVEKETVPGMMFTNLGSNWIWLACSMPSVILGKNLVKLVNVVDYWTTCNSLSRLSQMLLIKRKLHIIFMDFEWLWVTATAIQVPHLEIRPLQVLYLLKHHHITYVSTDSTIVQPFHCLQICITCVHRPPWSTSRQKVKEIP